MHSGDVIEFLLVNEARDRVAAQDANGNIFIIDEAGNASLNVSAVDETWVRIPMPDGFLALLPGWWRRWP